jgi:hypothetical protein
MFYVTQGTDAEAGPRGQFPLAQAGRETSAEQRTRRNNVGRNNVGRNDVGRNDVGLRARVIVWVGRRRRWVQG